MSKKVIWIINQTAGKPDSGWGERHFNFSKYWISKGYKVKIISGSYNHLFINQPKISNKTFTLEEIEENITFCWVKIPPYDGGSIFKLWSMIVFAFKVLFLKSSLLEKPSNIIVSSMPIFPILSGIYLKKKFNSKKLLFEIRDLWPLTPMYLSGYSKFHPMIILMSWIEKKGYKKSDNIVSLLPNASSYINKISGDASKFNWISNGIDEKLLLKESLPDSIIKQIPNNKFIIGYTGTMGMANALEYLIEASILMVQNKEVHFVLVGNGYLKKSLMQKTAGNLNITFIDKINKGQVQSILKHFNVCFVGRNDTPLFDYGVSSNKYFDYMLASKPVLESSNFIKSPVELSNCGITVLPESGKAIVEGILELQKMSTKKLEGIGENGLIYVRKYHNFGYLSDKYLKLF
ncbi:glycosyltransferase family 4 protein [Lutibacter flavus]|uniref:Glycosyltransferase involved in cell wall bisynthesis n=1 Tax=Lutibacter flavus TaxID=691689 RepID=A0A238VQ33_9FLAO|nr:glycosyltransferase family 4 protein [Lutibacter flavus]SNR36445.1 Glycosyltransferase involved in cell wall bisynthesis [Lutibacter flavus]